MKSFKSSFLNALNCIETEPREFTVVFLSRPKRRFGKVTEKSAIICAQDRFEALKIAKNRYGRNKILSCKEKQDNIRTDNFVTIM